VPDYIKLPSERVDQLRTLAKNLDMTIADCIGMFVNEQIEKGNLERAVPGIRIERYGKEIRIGSDEWNKLLSENSVEKLAAGIRAMLTPSEKETTSFRAMVDTAKSNPFTPIPDFILSRRGTSLKMRDAETGAEKTFAPSIAREFADAMEHAAKAKA
jgi:hypothetical protein